MSTATSAITTFLAPLTTQAVLPPCQSTVQWVIASTLLYWGLNYDPSRTRDQDQDQDIPINTCYPSRYFKDGVYSPGICPSGWSSACALGTDFPYRYASFKITLKSDTTGIVCCPSDFSCVNPPFSTYAYCASSYRAPQNSTFVPTYSAVTQTIIGGNYITLAGKPVLVAYQSTDAIAVSYFERRNLTSSLLSSSTTSTLSSSSAAASSTAITSPSGGLPTAAKISIGVLVPLIFILALVAGWLILRYRRRRLGQRSTNLHNDEIANAPMTPVGRGSGHFYDEPAHATSGPGTARSMSPQHERYELSNRDYSSFVHQSNSTARPISGSQMDGSSIGNDRSRVS